MTHLVEFFGRLHPMLVHLPIGFLVMAFILIIASHWKRAKVSRSALSLLFLFSAFTATLSCITGYLLSRSGEYNEETLFWHKWMGITLAITSTMAWLIIRDGKHMRTIQIFSAVLFVLLLFTGHWGASLTHGGDYLSEPLAAINQPEVAPLDLSKVNFTEVKFYPDLVHPIIERKCASCHGTEKQKGNLRLDSPEFIFKGGKSGKAVVPFRKDESELLFRIHLAVDDKKHMPPKEKPALTREEIQLLELWIETGADVEKKFAELVPEAKRQTLIAPAEEEQGIPDKEISPADPRVIESLTKQEVSIAPLSQHSNYLSVSFVSVPKQASASLKELGQVKHHVVALHLGGSEVTDEMATMLCSFDNLSRLYLDDAVISDKVLAKVASLTNLVFLNLKGTAVTARGIESLKTLPRLRHLFLYQTKISREDQAAIKSWFPHTIVDFGDYEVPTLASDTQEVKPPKR